MANASHFKKLASHGNVCPDLICTLCLCHVFHTKVQFRYSNVHVAFGWTKWTATPHTVLHFIAGPAHTHAAHTQTGSHNSRQKMHANSYPNSRHDLSLTHSLAVIKLKLPSRKHRKGGNQHFFFRPLSTRYIHFTKSLSRSHIFSFFSNSFSILLVWYAHVPSQLQHTPSIIQMSVWALVHYSCMHA